MISPWYDATSTGRWYWFMVTSQQLSSVLFCQIQVCSNEEVMHSHSNILFNWLGIIFYKYHMCLKKLIHMSLLWGVFVLCILGMFWCAALTKELTPCSNLMFINGMKWSNCYWYICVLVSLQNIEYRSAWDFTKEFDSTAETDDRAKRFPKPVNFSHSVVHVPAEIYVGGMCCGICIKINHGRWKLQSHFHVSMFVNHWRV